MKTIFYYELRRLVRNKVFIGLLIVSGIYAWEVLTSVTILGTAGTAPYSGWSFGAFLGSVMPIITLMVLLLLSVYSSKKEKRAEILLSVTPMKTSGFMLTRIGAVTVCFLITCAVIYAAAAWFYISVFKFGGFIDFILPSALVILPCYIFALGAGLAAGRIHPAALYALMLVCLAAGFLKTGCGFDFFGGGYFENYPLALPVNADGEPDFAVGAVFVAARFIYFITGSVLLAVGVTAEKRKGRRA